jgi:hypothetical protein
MVVVDEGFDQSCIKVSSQVSVTQGYLFAALVHEKSPWKRPVETRKKPETPRHLK